MHHNGSNNPINNENIEIAPEENESTGTEHELNVRLSFKQDDTSENEGVIHSPEDREDETSPTGLNDRGSRSPQVKPAKREPNEVDEPIPTKDVILDWVMESWIWKPSRWNLPSIPFLFFKSERKRIREMDDEMSFPELSSSLNRDNCQRVVTKPRSQSMWDGYLRESLNDAKLLEESDAGRIKYSASGCEIAVMALSMILHIIDKLCDVAVAVMHFMNGMYHYGGVTVAYIVAPYTKALIRNLFWECKNRKNEDFISTFELGEIFHALNYFKSMEWAIKSRRNLNPITGFYRKVDRTRGVDSASRDIDENVSLGDKLRFMCYNLSRLYKIRTIRRSGLDSLLQTAPQAELQLVYLIDVTLSRGTIDLGDIFLKFKVGLSLFLLSWAVQRQHYMLHLERRNEKDCGFVSSMYETTLLILTHGTRIGCLAVWTVWDRISFSAFWLSYILGPHIISFLLRMIRAKKELATPPDPRLQPKAGRISRVFTIEPEKMMWTLNSHDHTLYFLETMIMLVVIACLVNEFYLQMVATGFILLFLVTFALLYRFKKTHCTSCINCDENIS